MLEASHEQVEKQEGKRKALKRGQMILEAALKRAREGQNAAEEQAGAIAVRIVNLKEEETFPHQRQDSGNIQGMGTLKNPVKENGLRRIDKRIQCFIGSIGTC